MSNVGQIADWAKREHRAALREAAGADNAGGTMTLIHPDVVIALIDALDVAEAEVRVLAAYVQVERRLAALEAAESARCGDGR